MKKIIGILILCLLFVGLVAYVYLMVGGWEDVFFVFGGTAVLIGLIALAIKLICE